MGCEWLAWLVSMVWPLTLVWIHSILLSVCPLHAIVTVNKSWVYATHFTQLAGSHIRHTVSTSPKTAFFQVNEGHGWIWVFWYSNTAPWNNRLALVTYSYVLRHATCMFRLPMGLHQTGITWNFLNMWASKLIGSTTKQSNLAKYWLLCASNWGTVLTYSAFLLATIATPIDSAYLILFMHIANVWTGKDHWNL